MTTVKSKTSDERTPLDTAKLVLAGVLLAGGIVGFYLVPDWPTVYRVLALLALVVVSALLVFMTPTGRAIGAFAGEARTELRKVVWPTRQETLQTTLVVFVMVLIVAVFLWLLDMLLLAGVNRLMSIGGG